MANGHKHLIKGNAKTFWLIASFKQQYQSKMQQHLVNFSLSDAISIAKPDIDTDFQQAAMSHSNYDFQLIVNLFLNPNCEGACTDVASATICNESFKLIDVLCSEGDFSVPANFGNKDCVGVCAPSTTFPTLHNRKSKFIVASHYSKTFLHFSKGFEIFCEGY